jgi:hypothetical protein
MYVPISGGETERILIWGKTYPELSTKYFETVCTAGVRENGQPVRLYPISYRYLSERFKLYQWIRARIWKNDADPRPESYRIDCESIVLGEIVAPTSDEWGKRAEFIFRDRSWSFDSVETLLKSQKSNRSSIGIVAPRAIERLEIIPRPSDELQSFGDKLSDLRKALKAKRQQLVLFEQERALPNEMKSLQFLKSRLQVCWKCHNPGCRGHRMQVLDWGLCELQRREGDEAALAKLRDLCDLEKYSLRFFLGNLFMHPGSFMIVGLWYPMRANLLF